MINTILLTVILSLSLFFTGSVQMKEKADIIVRNCTIYTVDASNRTAECMAIRDGRIRDVGSEETVMAAYEAGRIIDLDGNYVFPGMIDAHCHFLGYALSLQYIDLTGCRSFDEVLGRLGKSGENLGKGRWIVGRGWDQNLWPDKGFPDNTSMNRQFPGLPVVLIRVDGHVVLANDEAMRRAGISMATHGGNSQAVVKNGKLTGILSETLADLMREAIPVPSGEELTGLLRQAEKDCFGAGLTVVSDAGLDHGQVRLIDSLQQSGILKMQVYGMLTPNRKNLEEIVSRGKYLTDRLFVRTIKIYADGSLGSRTALLKKSYADAPGVAGISVTGPDSIRELCRIALENDYQVNTHCIGDSANNTLLQIYGSFLKGKNDLRWRIEHAQVVDPADIHFFGDFSIVPSVQATHATSDMRWAETRLGPGRMEGAYAYRRLLQENGWIANGTDFPIEGISPVMTFYAAVSRQDITGYPAGGFMPWNALSREDALRSITIWAAKADFLEQRKGSLEVGKDADFVVLDQDIMNIPVEKIPATHILNTFLMGEEVFDGKP